MCEQVTEPSLCCWCCSGLLSGLFSLLPHPSKMALKSSNASPASSPSKNKRKRVDSNPNSSASNNQFQSLKLDPQIQQSRKSLPIWSGKEAIVDAVRNNDTVVVLGETGSGKTTRE